MSYPPTQPQPNEQPTVADPAAYTEPQGSYPAATPYTEQPVYTEPQQSYVGQPAPVAPPTTLAYTNTFALVSIITAFLAPIAAIIFGHMALGQIKRTGDAGRGLALTGLIIGYAYFVMIALFIIFYIGMIGLMIASFGAAASSFDSSYLDSSY